MSKNLTRAAFRRRDALALGLAAALPAARAQPASSAPLKIGFVYVTPVGDAGWTYQHDRGRRAMEGALGARVATTVVENVAEGPDAERVLRELARAGHKLIFATSFGYLEPALRVAAEFPDVVIEHAGGWRTARNVGTYNARFYEGRYLAGIASAHAARRGAAGYVAAFPLPEVIQGINAFAIGMRSVDPRATVRVVWLDAWFDPAREREAAVALADRGAGVLTHHSASAAVAQVAEERRLGFVAYQSDMRRVAPTSQLTAVIGEWGGYYARVARDVIAGTWRPDPVWGGVRDGFVKLAPFGEGVSRAAAAAVAAAEARLVAGTLRPFGTLDDPAIASMDRFVDGVVGTLPKG